MTTKSVLVAIVAAVLIVTVLVGFTPAIRYVGGPIYTGPVDIQIAVS